MVRLDPRSTPGLKEPPQPLVPEPLDHGTIIPCCALQIGRAFIGVYHQPPRAPRGGAFHHLGIETDDLAGRVREMSARGYVFRNPVREEKTFKYVMVSGPDELLIELFECHEPERWGIRPD